MNTEPSRTPEPILYAPQFEHVAQDEAEAIHTLQNIFAGMVNKAAESEGHAYRAVHAKGHALLRGTLTVPDNLPACLAQGLFAVPGSYEVLLRWSSPPPEQLPDSVSTPRAVAIKILEVPGERLDPAREGRSQDFLMVNAPAFARPGPQDLVTPSKLAAASIGHMKGAKQLVSALMRGAEGAIERLGGGSVKLKGAAGEPQHHPLGETCYTQTPFLYGQYMAKFSLAPVSPALLALTGKAIGNGDDAQRAAIGAFFGDTGAPAAEWELRVQLCVDAEAMPIEDASKAWPEELSPYVAVARLSVPRQQAWDDYASPQLEDETAYDPWNCLAAHRPLGAVNRARKEVMAVSRMRRSELNRCPIHEPAAGKDAAGAGGRPVEG